MKNKKIKGSVVGLFALILTLGLVASVIGFGVTAPYWGDNPLRLSPGQSKDVVLELQNMVGTEDITLRGEIIEGREIAELTDESTDFFVPIGRKDIKVHVKVTIPGDASIGDIYTVGVSFGTITTGTEGAVAMGGAIEKFFDVVVEEEVIEEGEVLAEEQGVNALVWVVVAAIVVLIIFLLVRRKK